MDLETCYLFLTPFQSTSPWGNLLSVPPPKDAPYFFDLDIEFRTLEKRLIMVEQTEVTIHFQSLDGLVWVAECRYWLFDALSETAVTTNRHLQAQLKQLLQTEMHAQTALTEEYTVLLLAEAKPTPDEFIDHHAAILARLLRSWTKSFNRLEANEILEARARFSEHDLTVVNWGGALIIAEKSDFQSDIELFKIGIYQLLSYSMLDQTISHNLEILRQHVAQVRGIWYPWSNRTLQVAVEQRLSLLLDFEKIDQSLLLIGDWYSARLYRLMTEQLGLTNWKTLVSFKLDSLATIDGVVREHLVFSWRRFFDFVTVTGWFILLIGYFVLFFISLK